MANQLTELYLALLDFVEPLRRKMDSPEALEYFFYRYGWTATMDDAALGRFRQAAVFVAPLEHFVGTAKTLRQKLAADGAAGLKPPEIAELAESAAALIRALVDFGPPDLSGLPDPLARAEFWDSIAEHVLDDLLEEYLRVYQSVIFLVLRLWKVIRYDATSPAESGRVPYARVSFDWTQAGSMLESPLKALEHAYNWDDAAHPFEHRQALDALLSVLRALRVRSALFTPALTAAPFAAEPDRGIKDDVLALRATLFERFIDDEGAFYRLGFEVFPAARTGEAGPTGLMAKPILQGGADKKLPLARLLTFRFSVNADAGDAIGFAVFPRESGIVGGEPALGTSLEVATAGSGPWYLLGNARTSRIETSGFSAKFSLEGTTADPDIKLRLACSGANGQAGCKVVVSLGDADSFIKQTTQRQSIEFGFSPEIIWSSKAGFSFNGRPTFDVDLPLGLQLGPITITKANIAVAEGARRTSATSIACRIGLDVKGKLGPVQFVVERLGFECSVIPHSRQDIRALPPGADAPVLGNLAVELSFAQPKGLGLAIDASAVVGGGYLFFDPQKGEYAGVLQLEIVGKISVKAFGLLSTRLPDGVPGYALIVFITAEGFQPIQLGMGFKLEGIGGMFAVNRTFDEVATREGLKNNTLATLLFPKDPVANAPQILRNLGTVFPIKPGSYLFGPMAKIGWATPTLITMDLALILEFGLRRRLIVLGRISSILPNRDEDLIRLNMDAMGVLDMDLGTLALDAVLVDSRLLQKFVLTGSMAMRACVVGPQAGLCLAVGGMNPHFTPPTNMPKLDRIAIHLTSGDNPRFTCDAYFAVTANTQQFGSRSLLYAAAYGFSIEGEVSFDVLVRLLPFHFIADFLASIQLKHGSTNLFKVKVEGELEGPVPLRLSAKATFEILWCDFSIRFDKTLVGGDKPPLPPAVDALEELKRALSSPDNWSAQIPVARQHGVTMRRLPPDAPLALDPLGQLTVRQSVLPLNTNRDLDTFGGAPIGEARRFTITAATLNDSPQAVQAAQDLFAPAQFFDLSDDERLASPSFETMDSGIVFGSDAIAIEESPDQRVGAPLKYDTIVVNADGTEEFPPNDYVLGANRLFLQAQFASVAKASIRTTGLGKFSNARVAPAVKLAFPGWRIVSTSDLKTTAPSTAPLESFGDASASVKVLNQSDAAGAAAWQLIPAYEIAS